MNGHIDDHMNQKELSHWMRMRRWKKQILIGELIYVFFLLMALIYNFALFMHMVVFQGIAISAYFVVGGIFAKNDSAIKVKKRDTLWETITSIRVNRLFFIRLFETVIFAMTLGVGVNFCFKLVTDIFQGAANLQSSRLIENFTLYGDFLSIVFLCMVSIAVLFALKKQLKIFSVLAFVILLAVVFTRNEMLVPVLVGLIGCVGAFALSFQPKL